MRRPLTKEQYYIWKAEHARLIQMMKFCPPLDRERSMLYLLDSMLLRCRLAVGLEDPGTPTHEEDQDDDDPDVR